MNNVNIRYVVIEDLEEDGISCTEGTFAVELSTDSMTCYLFNYENRDEFLEDFHRCKSTEDFEELISDQLSQDEMEVIFELLDNLAYVLYYGEPYYFKKRV